jgi:hypothetical protein
MAVNDSAKEWVTPFAMGGDWYPARVIVLNVGPTDVTARVEFYDTQGVKLSSEAQVVERSCTYEFQSQATPSHGWARVSADGPIFPSGQTWMLPYVSTAGEHIYGPMTFYRAEGAPITEMVRVPADVAAGLTPIPRS